MSERVPEVLVLGAGAAGALAAAAAKESGASVRLITRGLGASALFSGAIDLAGDLSATPEHPLEEQTDLRANLSALLAQEPWHPYHVLAGEFDGPESKAGHILRLFGVAAKLLEARAGLSFSRDEQHNRARITPMGTFKFSAASLPGLGAYGIEELGNLRPVFVGFAGLPGAVPERQARVFDAVRGAREGTSRHAEVSLPETLGSNASGVGLATLLEDETYAKSVAARVAEVIHQSGADAVFFPPVLGIDRAEECRKIFSETLRLPVVETLAAPPSVPGVRLEQALERLLKKAAVEVTHAEVLAIETEKRVARRVRVRHPDGKEETLAFQKLVLATGKFLGGGLRKNGTIREALLDLPLFWHGERFDSKVNEEIFDRRLLSEQAAFGVGVKTDKRLRPVDETRRVLYENLHAAGALLGGYDSVGGPSAMGLVLVSGYAAGQWAGAK